MLPLPRPRTPLTFLALNLLLHNQKLVSAPHAVPPHLVLRPHPGNPRAAPADEPPYYLVTPTQ